MDRIFRIVKKKTNLRRLSVVWLLLIAIEFLCPVFCEARPLTVVPDFPTTVANLTIGQKVDAADDSSFAVYNDSTHDPQNQTVCNDECICHAVAIPGTNFVMPKEPLVRSGRMAFHFDEPIFNSLAPLYHPPKLS